MRTVVIFTKNLKGDTVCLQVSTDKNAVRKYDDLEKIKEKIL